MRKTSVLVHFMIVLVLALTFRSPLSSTFFMLMLTVLVKTKFQKGFES